MKKLILTALFAILVGHTMFAQDYIYKRNSFGQIEVFESSNGFPQGQKLATIKRNIYGYIEVENSKGSQNITTTENPYSRMPTITPITPYLAPVVSIMNTINTFIEVNKKVAASQNNQTLSRDGVAKYKATMEKMAQQYTQFTNFYNSVPNKPSKVKDGWHSVVIMSSSLAKDFNEINKAGGIQQIEKLIQLGYGYVVNNKLQKTIECSFTQTVEFVKPSILSGNAIENCKTYYKWKDSKGVPDEVYFIDYILDETEIASLPLLGTFKFNFSDKIEEGVAAVIYNKDPAIYGENGDHYVCMKLMPKLAGGWSEELSSFISYPGTYYYIALDKRGINGMATFHYQIIHFLL